MKTVRISKYSDSHASARKRLRKRALDPQAGVKLLESTRDEFVYVVPDDFIVNPAARNRVRMRERTI